jgi:FdhD protein
MNAVVSELGWPSYQRVEVEQSRSSERSSQIDCVAEEIPVALVYNNVPHVVMLASPLDLEDFAVGFSLTEGIVAAPSQISSIRVLTRAEGIEVRLRIPPERFGALADKGRNLAGRTGCGLCGASTLKQAVRHPRPVSAAAAGAVALQHLHEAMAALPGRQTLNQLTGAVHAAAWVLPGQGIAMVREDVGRHNALDKLIGALLRIHSDRSAGFVIVTSRASYEMVQKCAVAGIGLIAAISAPTGLAIRLAEECGVTLLGFVRGGDHVVYSHPRRLVSPP